MKVKQVPFLPLLAIVTIALFAFTVDQAFADGDTSKLGKTTTVAGLGEHGGGDPDNPVPVDGGGESLTAGIVTPSYVGDPEGNRTGIEWILGAIMAVGGLISTLSLL